MNDDSVAQEERLPDDQQANEGSNPGDADAEALRAKADENWSKYLRALAELDNLRKRSARELEAAHKFGAERLASGILPVRDSLEAGIAALSVSESQQWDAAAIVDGERATLRLLDQALEAAGIREIDPQGELFDPNRHEAMSMLPSSSVEPNTVLQVVQKGYELHDRLLRPARVIVARAP